ncbi:MAG TPA: hypothetical protein VFW21_13805 [Mycobacterium sp.]|nr:hypothetical protein [Mycobacterium sp.]
MTEVLEARKLSFDVLVAEITAVGHRVNDEVPALRTAAANTHPTPQETSVRVTPAPNFEVSWRTTVYVLATCVLVASLSALVLLHVAPST